MASSKNTKLVSHIDCAGGGQVWVDGRTLYIGHMQAPTGTTIVDISDPRQPKTLARIDLPQGWHSHKVRVANDIMIVNHEVQGKGGPADYRGGLAIYDVKNPASPKQIAKWETDGAGVHRYDFDGRYAYV
ncbi:MAG: LVIVD repeat-containing protein [Xanthobacteraceae bacterium]